MHHLKRRLLWSFEACCKYHALRNTAAIRCVASELVRCGTKRELAAFAPEAAFVRISDLHFGLHASCTPTVNSTLFQTDALSTPPWVL